MATTSGRLLVAPILVWLGEKTLVGHTGEHTPPTASTVDTVVGVLRATGT